MKELLEPSNTPIHIRSHRMCWLLVARGNKKRLRLPLRSHELLERRVVAERLEVDVRV